MPKLAAKDRARASSCQLRGNVRRSGRNEITPFGRECDRPDRRYRGAGACLPFSCERLRLEATARRRHLNMCSKLISKRHWRFASPRPLRHEASDWCNSARTMTKPRKLGQVRSRSRPEDASDRQIARRSRKILGYHSAGTATGDSQLESVDRRSQLQEIAIGLRRASNRYRRHCQESD